MRETVAVADLIPGDVLPNVGVVMAHPYGVHGMEGSMVSMCRLSMNHNRSTLPIECAWYYPDSEEMVDIIR